MATKGQLLERLVVIPAGPLCLDGIYLRGESPGLVVASPLPGRGGSMAGPIASELAYAAAYAGCASLRIDYRGVGASEGVPSSDPADAAADLAEGVAFLTETTRAETVSVAAYHSGVWAALLLATADPRVESLILIAPEWDDAPADLPTYSDCRCPVRVVLPGAEPSLDLAGETERVDAARNARLQVIPTATRTFREALAQLARVVPPVLGRDVPE